MINDFEEPLPHWATRRAHGELCVGAQLCTRDGRKTGNAVIVDVTQGSLTDPPRPIYVVITDSGTRLILLGSEVEWLYYPPEYVMDVQGHLGVEAWKKGAYPAGGI